MKLLVFHRPPEPLDEDVVEATALAVHQQLQSEGQQGCRKLGRRELAPLVGVEDFQWSVPRDGPLHGAHTETRVERVRQFPREPEVAVAVEDSAAIHVATLHRNLSDVRRPDLIWPRHRQVAQQIRIDPLAG